MSNLIQCKPGMSNMLHWYTTGSGPSGSRTIMLFQNNYTPGPPSVLANLTPATFPGYSPYTFSSAYGSPVDDGTYIKANAPLALFACTSTPGAAQTIYGYGVVQNGTDLLWAQRFASSTTISASGQAIVVEHQDRVLSQSLAGGSGQCISISGLDDMLRVDIAQIPADTAWTVKLFTNSPSLSRNSVAADFVEPSYTGYGSQSVPTFNTPVDISVPPSWYAFQALAPYNLFQPSVGWTGSETINGYFVVGNSSGLLKWAAYISPVTLVNELSIVYLVTNLALGSLFNL